MFSFNFCGCRFLSVRPVSIKFPSTFVRIETKRPFSLGLSTLSRLKGSHGRISLRDKSFNYQTKRLPQSKSTTRSAVVPVSGVRNFSRIFLRCGLFTFFSINTVFAGTMIWSYENWKSYTSRYQKGELRKLLRNSFTSIVGRPPKSTDIFWAIAFVNLVVFLGNNSRRVGTTFLRYFANSPFGPWPATSMVLSIFSHQMFFHMFINMYVLHNFTQPLVRLLGMEQFFAVFLGGGIFASFLSVLAKAIMRSPIPSIGASGAVCAALGTFCMLEPQAQLCVPLLVNIMPHSFSAGSTCWAILAFEACGAILLVRRSPIDHAAHLGGLLFGMYYGMEGKEVVWKHRNTIIGVWQRFKGEKGKSNE
uniref:rhomboid protease n=1 Tax=Mesocestoides corti TaxID=53468 RepID=A0A5K3F926_MESCO